MVVTYFAGRIGTVLHMLLLSPENGCVCVCLFVSDHSYSCALQLHSILRNKAVRPSFISRGRSSCEGKMPRGSRERALVYVQCEPKNNDEVALQQLPSNFAISFEDMFAQP